MPRKPSALDTPDSNWMVSYADMMTLLLYLFIILYAMAILNQGKVQATVESFYSMFTGGGNKIAAEAGYMGNAETNPPETTYDKAKKFVADNKLESKVDVMQGPDGVFLEVQEKVLFDSGSSKIKVESYGVLNEISTLLGAMPNDIIVIGHTDNRPMSSGTFQTNWELSNDRAVKIVRYFIEKCSLKPERFETVGRAEYNPIADNNTAEGRQKNRRVEIIIKEVDK